MVGNNINIQKIGHYLKKLEEKEKKIHEKKQQQTLKREKC